MSDDRTARRSDGTRFGGTSLPQEQQDALRQAIRLEWITLAAMTFSVVLVFLVSGSSQAMKAAWIEDTLSLLPPIAFLVAVRVIRRAPSERHPYGYHRAIGIAHLVAAVALCTLGSYVLIDSALGLIAGDRPPMGTVVLFGWQLWSGWLMCVTMLVVAIGPMILGRLKQKPAQALHDKVVYADADMSKADWQTALATIVGVLGVGAGLWWADAVAAIFVAASILKDGISLLVDAVRSLADARPTTYDGEDDDPIVGRVCDALRGLPWVDAVGARIRDEGHVLHAECFVVPRVGESITLDRLDHARELVRDLDWRLADTVVVPVRELAPEQVPGAPH